MNKWDAPCDLLITLGWGRHLRHQIPDDFLTRRGPDGDTWHKRQPKPRKPTWRERRAQWEAARAQP